ncbi:MAG: GAF domain-containing protein, partial [Chloroflexota bacterium]|nr:GAF domain-containing protein [Chloroflexota bacterium]
RELAEQALRESEEQLRATLSSMDDLVFTLDEKGVFVDYYQPELTAELHVPPEVFIGKPYQEVMPPNVVQPAKAAIETLKSTGAPQRFDYSLMLAGQEKWFSMTISLRRDTSGQFAGITAVAHNITERVRVEESLREERNFAENLVNTAQTIILVLDVEGRIVRFNPYMETLSGYSLAEVQGQDWFSTFLPAQDHSRIRAVFQKAVKDIQTRGNVNSIVTKDGRERQIEWNDKTLKDAAGNVVGLLAIGQDITARVRAEKEIKRHSRQLVALHKADLAIAANLDLHTVLTQVLNEAQALLSAEAASVLLPDSTGDKLIFTAVVGIGAEVLKGTHILADAGVAGWVMREAQPVLITDVQTDPRFYANIDVITGLTTRSLLAVPLLCKGKTLGVIEVINRENERFNEHDLDLLSTLAGSAVIAIENARLYEETTRRLAETRVLQEIMLASASTLNFDQVLTNTLQAIHRTLHIEYLDFVLPDEAGARMVVHPSYIGFIPPPEGSLHLPLDGSVAGRVYTTGQPELLDDTDKIPYYFKFKCLSRELHSKLAVPVSVNDRVVAVLNAESPHRGAFGEDDLRLFQAIAAQLGIVMENARLYETEREQRKLAERSWSQLVQSEKLAATGRLAASLAHEINNPLQAIHNSLQLLLSFSLEADEQHEYLQMADEEVARLIGMVTRILDFARRPQQELRPTNVNDVLEKVLTLSGKYLQHRRIVLRRDLSPDLPVILASPNELGQVFLNLVLNAMDAMPEGGTLRVASRMTEDGRLIMTISDTGHGISPEHLTRAFEPFFSTKEKGTGLGLFVSHNIVRRHGGEITVQSKVGAGTTFTVRLPAARDANGVS